MRKKVMAGLKASEEELTRLGYEVEACLTDFGDTAEAVHEHAPKAKICFNTAPNDTAAAVQRCLNS